MASQMIQQQQCYPNWSMWVDHIDDGDAVVHITEVAQAPAKDFYQICVTSREIFLRVWKIVPPTRKEKALPYELRETLSDFEHAEKMQSEIQRVGGTNLLNYLCEVCRGHLDYLPRLPKPTLIKLILMLDLEDISALSRVNKKFRELCNSDDIWSEIYAKNSETPITEELKLLASGKSWKRLFFTNKLQLQMHLRRMKNPDAPPAGGYAFLTSQDQEMEDEQQ